MVLYVSPSAVHTGAYNLCARYTAHKSLLIIIPSTAVPYTLLTAYLASWTMTLFCIYITFYAILAVIIILIGLESIRPLSQFTVTLNKKVYHVASVLTLSREALGPIGPSVFKG